MGKHRLKRGLRLYLHKFYGKWNDMMQRCYNSTHKQYKDYGGRGILVAEGFHDCEVYCKYLENLPGFGVDGKTTLDRINNDDDYRPGNLRWATRLEQNRNRRVFKSGYSGVSYNNSYHKWRAYYYVNNKMVHVGTYATKEEAVTARTDALLKTIIK